MIKFNLSKLSNVSLKVFNIKGQMVADLLNCKMKPGIHNVNFDGSSLTSGVYYYNLHTEDNMFSRKMILLK